MRGVWARAEQQRSEGCILDTGYGGKWTTLGEFTSFSSLVLTPDPNIGKPTCPLFSRRVRRHIQTRPPSNAGLPV